MIFTVVMMKHEDRKTLSRVSVVTFENLSDVMLFLADNFGGDSEKFHFYRFPHGEDGSKDFYICMKPARHNGDKFDMIQVFGNDYGEIRPVNQQYCGVCPHIGGIPRSTINVFQRGVMTMKKVEFISYDGKFPYLCLGKLIIKIGGKEISFGFTSGCCGNETPADYPRFWSSGGGVYFSKDGDEFVDRGRWQFDKREFPKEYKEYFDEICRLFEENVHQGCCGGCV